MFPFPFSEQLILPIKNKGVINYDTYIWWYMTNDDIYIHIVFNPTFWHLSRHPTRGALRTWSLLLHLLLFKAIPYEAWLAKGFVITRSQEEATRYLAEAYSIMKARCSSWDILARAWVMFLTLGVSSLNIRLLISQRTGACDVWKKNRQFFLIKQ